MSSAALKPYNTKMPVNVGECVGLGLFFPQSREGKQKERRMITVIRFLITWNSV